MKRLSVFSNAVFNSAGAILYSLCQWAITMAAVRLSGDFENSGILQLAISVTNIFYTAATYVPRTFQISDLRGEYSSGEYVGMRLVSSALSLLLCIVYAFASGYRGKVLVCIAVYMLFKLTEAVSDVYRAYAQIHYRMDLEFVSYAVRGILSLSTFLAVMKLTGDILLAVAAMALPAAAAVVLVDLPAAKRFVSVRPVFLRKKLLQAAKACLPVTAASFLSTAYATLPRQSLLKLSGAEALGAYASVATPVVIIQLLATSVFNPMLMRFTELYRDQNRKGMRRFFLGTAAGLLGCAAAAFAGAALLGEPVYVLLYGETIRPYCGLMYAVILSAVMYAACWLLNNVLVIMRKHRARILSAVAGLAVIVLCGRPLILRFGMNGVSFAVILGYAVGCGVDIAAIVMDSEKI